MKSRELIEALLATLGVYYIVQNLALVLATMFQLDADGALRSLGVSLIPGAVGVGLIAARRNLAARLSTGASDEAGIGSSDLLGTLLGVTGVYLVVSAISSGAASVAHEWLVADSLPPQVERRPYEVWPGRVEVLAKLALGIGIATGRGGIAWLLRTARTAGRQGSAV